MAQQKHPSSRRYPPEVKERAVQLVLTTMKQQGERHGVVTRLARQLDIGPETLRNWVRQAEVDNGDRPELTTDERRRIAELEKENRELRRANQILKEASVFFAQELDRPRDGPLHRVKARSFRCRAPVPNAWGIAVDLLRKEDPTAVCRSNHRCVVAREDREGLHRELLGLRSQEGVAAAAPRRHHRRTDRVVRLMREAGLQGV
jgi:transposase